MQLDSPETGSPASKSTARDEQLADSVSEAKRWFIAKKGIERETTIPIYSGTVEYDVPPGLRCSSRCGVPGQSS